MFSLLDSQFASVGSNYDIFTEEYMEALYHIYYGDEEESHTFLDHRLNGKQKSEPASEFKDVKTIQIPFEEEFEGYW
jgi:hypothetical protein